MNLLAEIDIEKFLAGQSGFIMATLIFGIWYWRVMLPRQDRQTEVIAKLADGVKVIAIYIHDQQHKSGKEMLDTVEGLTKPDKCQ